MDEHQAEVIVAGHICLDIIPTLPELRGGLASLLVPGKLVKVAAAVTSTGGAVSNTGLALDRLGFHTRLIGKVGDDLLGRAVLEVLRGQNPALAKGMIVAKEEASSYTVVISPPGVDRIFLHCPGANDTFASRDIDYEPLRGARLFHFGYPPIMRGMHADGGADCARMLKRVRELGLTTSLDMAMPDPDSEAGRADWEAFLTEVLPHVDVFLPSVEEIHFMLRHGRTEAMPRPDGPLLAVLSERLLSMGAAIVVLKLGDQGLYLRTTGDSQRLSASGRGRPKEPDAWRGREMLAPCFDVKVVGTTGSGDCTIAGFLGGLLKDLSPEETVTAAVGVGAFNVERADATSGVPDWSTLQKRIAAGWKRREVDLELPGWTWDRAASVWRGPAEKEER